MEKVQVYCSKCKAKLNIPSKLHIRFNCPTCGEKYEAINGLVLNVIAVSEKLPTEDPPFQSIKNKKNYTTYILISIPALVLIYFLIANSIDRWIKDGYARDLRDIKEKPLIMMINCLKKHDFSTAYVYAAPETAKYIKIIEAMYVFGDSISISQSIESLRFDQKQGQYYLTYDSDSVKNNILPIEFVQNEDTYMIKVDPKYILGQ